MIIGRDVTELKEHEQELARERELMQTMLDNMGDGVVLAQPDGEWILVNKPLYRINGWPEDVHSNSCSYDDVRWLLENGHLMDDYGLTGAIRVEEARLGLVRTPIVAVTANAMRGEEERCIEAGMDAYLGKPVALGRLTATLERWVALTPQDAASPLRALERAPAAFDLAALRDWFGEDVGAIRAIVDEFIATAQVAVEQIVVAVTVLDFAAITVAAHRVRGAALTGGRASHWQPGGTPGGGSTCGRCRHVSRGAQPAGR